MQKVDHITILDALLLVFQSVFVYCSVNNTIWFNWFEIVIEVNISWISDWTGIIEGDTRERSWRKNLRSPLPPRICCSNWGARWVSAGWVCSCVIWYPGATNIMGVHVRFSLSRAEGAAYVWWRVSTSNNPAPQWSGDIALLTAINQSIKKPPLKHLVTKYPTPCHGLFRNQLRHHVCVLCVY